MNINQNCKEIDKAYVDSAYRMRFFNPSPREVCREIGLNWLAALRLRESGWLSYDPEVKIQLEEPEETELRFLGSLVAWGLDESQLSMILKDLRKPYRYRIEIIYFDWLEKGWRPLPSSDKIDDIQRLIDDLKEDGEIDELRSLYDSIRDALDELKAMEEEEDENR